MLIAGAKGLAKEILQILQENSEDENLYFYDDVNKDIPFRLYDKYIVHKNENEALNLFSTNPKFTLGLGDPKLRKILYQKFTRLGGKLTSTISKSAYISSQEVTICKGANIMSGVKISNGVSIGVGILAYYDVTITHDVKIGDFVELSPGCKLLGRVIIEDGVSIGAGAIILPDLKIGEGAVIGAGAIVTKNVNRNTVVVGNPAKGLIK